MWKNAQLLCAAMWAVGCAPLSPTPPFHVAETAQILRQGQVGVTGVVGGGNFETIGAGVGMGTRVRVGVGGPHEVGVEGVLFRRMNQDEPTPEQPWKGRSNAWLGKGTWKVGATSWLAFAASAGGSHSATGNALGGDVALIGSTPELLAEQFRPYLGVRGGAAVPVGRERDEAGGRTEALTVAIGSTWQISPAAQLLGEIGWLNEWNKGYFSTEVNTDRMVQSQHHPGAYIALGGGVTF